MANFSQSNAYSQYMGYNGSNMQFDASQNKWVQPANTGNQTQMSQSQQNQQQMYQATAQAAEYYAAASGYYGNQYGQQQNYNSDGTGSGAGNTNMTGGRASTSTTGKNTMTGNFGNPNPSAANSNVGNNSNTGSFGSGTFGNNAAGNSTNALGQMFGGAYGNSGQTSGMNSNMTNNMMGQNTTATAMGQLSQMFGNATGFGNNMSGDTTGGAGYNAFNSGMMTLLQQTLLQQANGAAAFGDGTGNYTWGMPDGSGGYYAAPMDSSFQFGGAMESTQQGKKGKKWSGKDNKQDFYGNRFAQMFTGMPGMLGQPQGGKGKGKRLQDGVRINVKGEKVVDVEVPLSLYSRWGQLRKYFYKQDTDVVKHLISFHDEMCEDCLEREQRKKTGSGSGESLKEKTVTKTETEEQEAEEVTEEDLVLKQLMGFGSFNTTRGAMVEGNQVDAVSSVAVPDKSVSSDSSWEAKAGFIGPEKPSNTEGSQSETSETQSEAEKSLTEQEKHLMLKLGWTVFNKKTDKKENESDGVNDDGDDDKVDDGGKDGSANEGEWKAPEEMQT